METIEIDLQGKDSTLTVYIDVYRNSLSRKWIGALNDIIRNNLHLEKNYCWFGFVDGPRSGALICNSINQSIAAINHADLGYSIDDYFSLDNCIIPGPVTGVDGEGGDLEHEHLNKLHRYFEDLQGVSGNISKFYQAADSTVRWHIRQLNLLCHELESWILSARKMTTAPEWCRPSQLMCWLNAPRFELEEEDYDLFGIDTINRDLGGVYVGVNKAVGKHHWEVFCDEGRDSRVSELVTSTLRSQTQAAGDFDIEWANNPGTYPWQKAKLDGFREWLVTNGFDPTDKTLTIGHPKVAQVDLQRSFGTEDYTQIWAQLTAHLNVYKIRTGSAEATYNYNWSDPDYMDQQIKELK